MSLKLSRLTAAAAESPNSPSYIELDPPANRGRYRWIGAGALSAISTVALGVLRYVGKFSSPVPSTLLEIGMGACFQSTVECLAPRGVMKKIHGFQKSYSLAEFLILWQIIDNLPEESPARQGLLALMCAYEGSCLVINISSIAGKTLAEMNPGKHYSTKRQFHLWSEPVTGRGKKVTQAIKIMAGTTLLATSPIAGDWEGHFQNIGALIVGHAVGELTEKAFHKAHMQAEALYASEIATGGEIPSKLAWMRYCSSTAEIFRRQAWGMLTVVAHPAAYGAIGLLIGSAKSGELRNFEKLLSITPETKPSKCVQRSKLLLDGTLLAGAATFCIYEMATGHLTDQIALSSFMGGVAGGILIDRIANNAFDPPTNKPLINCIKFYTEHTDPLAFTYLYLKKNLALDGKILAQGETSEHITAFFAYLLLGANVGFGAQNERFPVTFDASMGDFIIWKSKGGT